MSPHFFNIIFLFLSLSQAGSTPESTDCSALSAYVYVTSHQYSDTLLSARVNYAPYDYVLSNKTISLFPSELDPCDPDSLSNSPKSAKMVNTVVLIDYDSSYTCNPQEWTLNLENIGAKGVLVGETELTSYVYVLDGSHTVANPTIPTRMITSESSNHIAGLIGTNETVTVTIDCFDNSYPSVVCISDTSDTGNYLHWDGEYQRRFNLSKNDHPVWVKEGTAGLNQDLYIFLEADHNDGWWWIIYSALELDYNQTIADNTELLEQGLFSCNESGVTDPTLCNHWHYENNYMAEITASGDYCELGDTFFCIQTDNTYMVDVVGTYRQLHPGQHFFVKELKGSSTTTNTNLWMRLSRLNTGTWTWMVWSYQQSSSNVFESFCSLRTTIRTDITVYEPWTCTPWYSYDRNGYYHDNAFQVDEHFCGYNVTTVDTTTYVSSSSSSFFTTNDESDESSERSSSKEDREKHDAKSLILGIAIAAGVLVFLAAVLYCKCRRPRSPKVQQSFRATKDIAPDAPFNVVTNGKIDDRQCVPDDELPDDYL